MSDKAKITRENCERFGAFYAGRRLSDKNKMVQHFKRTDTGRVLVFSTVKISHFSIGSVYSFGIADEEGNYFTPGFKDIMHDATPAAAEDITRWQMEERADLQLQRAVNFKPPKSLETLVDDLKYQRMALKGGRRMQFDAWLMRELWK